MFKHKLVSRGFLSRSCWQQTMVWFVAFGAAYPAQAWAATKNFNQYTGLVTSFAVIPADIITSFLDGVPGLVNTASGLLTDPLLSFANAAIVMWTTFQLFRMLSVTHANDPGKAIDLIVNRLFLYIGLVSFVKSQMTVLITSYIVPTVAGLISLGASLQTMGPPVPNCPMGNGAYAALTTAADAYVCQTSQSFLNGFGVGIYLLENTFTTSLPFINFGALCAGIALIIIFGWQVLKLPMAVIDSLFRFSIVVILLPVFVMSYLFVPTRGFFKKGVESLIVSGLSLTMTGIAAGLCMTALDKCIGHLATGGGAATGIMAKIGDTAEPTVLGPISLTNFITIVVVGMSIGSAMKLGPKLAAEFIGFSGDMGGPGSAAGAAVGSVAKQGLKLGATYAGGVAGGKIGAAIASRASGDGGKAGAGDASMA